MPDLNQTNATQTVRIAGGDENHEVDVILDGGVRKLAAKADVTVNSLRGFDPIADTWFFIGTEADTLGVGGPGDTVRVQILAGDDATKFPAVDVTTTVLAGWEEVDLANAIVSNLNADANFSLNFSTRKLFLDAVTVYITAKRPGPEGARPNINDFLVTTTGTTVATRAFDNIVQRQKNTSLARDPANPTLGVIGISGSVSASSGEVTGRFVHFFENGGSNNLRVNGSSTPVVFSILTDATRETFIESIRFEAAGNGIKFGQFFSKSGGELTNGVSLKIRSNDSEFIFPALKATENFLNEFAFGPDNFNVFIQSGTDQCRATLTFGAPFQLFKSGTFTTDDFLSVTIQDNLSSGLTSFKALVSGFFRDF